MTPIEKAADSLARSADGERVKQQLSHHYRTLGSLKRAMSDVRAILRARGHEECLAEFKFTQAESSQLKRESRAALVKKNENVTLIEDAPALLQTVTAMLQDATSRKPYPELILPLAFVSGRRLVELVNGESTFTRTASSHHVIFEGVCKKRTKSKPAIIPILVEYPLFERGWNALCEKLGDSVNGVNNRASSARFQSNLYVALRRGILPGMPQPAHGVHSLRATYLAFIWEMFDCGHYSLPRTGQHVLLHDFMSEVLHYTTVRLKKTHGLPTLGSLLEATVEKT